MERNKIYVHTSNLDYTKFINEDELFIPVFEYPISENKNLHKNEYGMIRTKYVDIHILFGNLKQEDCPWCGSECKMKNIYKAEEIRGLSRYCIQCLKCGARGPIMNVNPLWEDDKECTDRIFESMEYRFTHRRPWDDRLKKETDEKV